MVIYGKWVREHAALAEIDGSIFLHGGIHPGLAKSSWTRSMLKFATKSKASTMPNNICRTKKVILPFFNLQEITAAFQAEIIAERKSQVTTNAQKQATAVAVPGLWGLAERKLRTARCGFAAMTSGPTKMAPPRSTKFWKPTKQSTLWLDIPYRRAVGSVPVLTTKCF